MKITNEKKKKIYIGEVLSDKMDKTIVVKTERTFRHEKFHKILKKVKKYKVHDEHQKSKVGDIVEFCEGRPISKTKYMHFVRVLKVSR